MISGQPKAGSQRVKCPAMLGERASSGTWRWGIGGRGFGSLSDDPRLERVAGVFRVCGAWAGGRERRRSKVERRNDSRRGAATAENWEAAGQGEHAGRSWNLRAGHRRTNLARFLASVDNRARCSVDFFLARGGAPGSWELLTAEVAEERGELGGARIGGGFWHP